MDSTERRIAGSKPARSKPAAKPEAQPEAKPAKPAKAGVPCGCGCGVTTNPGRSFRQGHDAKRHSALAAELRDSATPAERRAAILAEYGERGWKPAEGRTPKAADPAAIRARIAELQAKLAAAEAAVA